ncbi:MAG: mechanosensitive ion channel family protein [Nanoarchaeota archaeon]|nr:mechanosensitive ion channel family protein [Nanoarchaeota archaeon]
MDPISNVSIVGESINNLPNLLSGIFTKLVVAVIIVLIGLVAGKLLGKLIHKLLHEIELNKLIKKSAGIKISAEEIISFFVTYFIYFIFIVMALNQLGLTTVVLHMISGAILIIIIISIMLSIKDFMPNMFAGFFIHQKRFIKEGDIIKVDNIKGKIMHINLVETTIETKQGDIIYIPNSLLTKKTIVKVKKKKIS